MGEIKMLGWTIPLKLLLFLLLPGSAVVKVRVCVLFACTCLLRGGQAVLRGAEDAADQAQLVHGELCSFGAFFLLQQAADGETAAVAAGSGEKQTDVTPERKSGKTATWRERGVNMERGGKCWHASLLITCSCWILLCSCEVDNIDSRVTAGLRTARFECLWLQLDYRFVMDIQLAVKL